MYAPSLKGFLLLFLVTVLLMSAAIPLAVNKAEF